MAQTGSAQALEKPERGVHLGIGSQQVGVMSKRVSVFIKHSRKAS